MDRRIVKAERCLGITRSLSNASGVAFHHCITPAASIKTVYDAMLSPRLYCCMLGLMFFLIPIVSAKTQAPFNKWSPVSSIDFSKYSYVFSPYGINAPSDNISALTWSTIRIFRVELSDFCRGRLCLTIVLFDCQKAICPSTAIFAEKVVLFDKHIVNYFGGTSFVSFPLGKDKSIEVMINGRFVSVWRGFGETED